MCIPRNLECAFLQGDGCAGVACGAARGRQLATGLRYSVPAAAVAPVLHHPRQKPGEDLTTNNPTAYQSGVFETALGFWVKGLGGFTLGLGQGAQ